jgi:hypothetical protein
MHISIHAQADKVAYEVMQKDRESEISPGDSLHCEHFRT